MTCAGWVKPHIHKFCPGDGTEGSRVGVFGDDTEARPPGCAKYKAATAATTVVPTGVESVEVGGAQHGKRSRVIEVPASLLCFNN